MINLIDIIFAILGAALIFAIFALFWFYVLLPKDKRRARRRVSLKQRLKNKFYGEGATYIEDNPGLDVEAYKEGKRLIENEFDFASGAYKEPGVYLRSEVVAFNDNCRGACAGLCTALCRSGCNSNCSGVCTASADGVTVGLIGSSAPSDPSFEEQVIL